MINNLNELVNNVKETAYKVSSSAQQLNASAEETTSSVNEIAESTFRFSHMDDFRDDSGVKKTKETDRPSEKTCRELLKQ